MTVSTPPPEVDVDSASRPNAGLLLDVRELVEWASGHAPAAVHVPLAELPGRLDEIERGAHVICVCRSGNRSGRVTQWLREQGYDAVNMAGGMQAWARAGHPVVTDTGAPGCVI